MKPGPELDALVAEKVLGWHRCEVDRMETIGGGSYEFYHWHIDPAVPCSADNCPYHSQADDFRPSTYIEDALIAAEKAMRAEHAQILWWRTGSARVGGPDGSGSWAECSIGTSIIARGGETPAHALALALLKAAGNV